MDLVKAEAAAVKTAGHKPLLHGAKITGGGSGGEKDYASRHDTDEKFLNTSPSWIPSAGTVCVMTSSDEAAKAAIERVRQAYKEARDHMPEVFSGSTMGAWHFGVVILQLRRQSLAQC